MYYIMQIWFSQTYNILSNKCIALCVEPWELGKDGSGYGFFNSNFSLWV